MLVGEGILPGEPLSHINLMRMKTLYLFVVFGVVASLCATQAQQVYYVTPEGGGDGSSWASATTLEQAIGSASGTAEAADIILVKKGTYTAPATDGLGFYFQTKKQIVIYGNCEGTESETDLPVIDEETPIETYLVAPVDENQEPVSRVITIYKGSVAFEGFDISGGTSAFSTSRGPNEGGSVWIYGQGVLRKCHIHGSSSQKGGGVYLSTFEEGKEAGLESCHVYNNSSTGDGKSSLGGGVYMKNNTFVKDCVIEDNVSPYTGGGIYCESTGVVYNSVIRNNRAEKNSSGGIWIHSGVIANCLIIGNQAMSVGAGVQLGSEEAQIINSTVVSNQLNNTSGSAISGGIMVDNGHVKNCIVWGNTVNGGTVERDIRISNMRTGTLTNTCYKVASIVPADAQVIDCIQDDPLFVDVEGGDYRLAEGSPCIDTGNNDLYAVIPMDTDLDGESRIENNTIDRGAYEYRKDISTGVTELTDEPRIYAVAGRLIIAETEGNLMVYDVLGRLRHTQIVSGQAEITLPSGIYIVRLNDICRKVSIR